MAAHLPRALRTIALTAAALAALTALTGCGASEPVPATSTGAVGEGRTAYPLTIENCGVAVTFAAAPERTVSLDQDSTEILLSLGLEERMVGTASWTDPVLPALAEANARVPRLADNAPTYEVLMGAEPDFVTASFGRHFKDGGVVTRDRLSSSGIPSYLSPTDCDNGKSINGGTGQRTTALTVDTLYQEIRELAEIFDVPSRGDALIADACSQFRKVARIVGTAMMATEDSIKHIPDLFYASRVRKLVEEGRLVSEGNLEYMRFSEVKLPEK